MKWSRNPNVHKREGFLGVGQADRHGWFADTGGMVVGQYDGSRIAFGGRV